jgi:general secretion pathway protein K
VLCVLAVLSVIAVTLIRETREETRFESAVVEDAKAEALAEGAIQQSMVELLIPPGNGAWQADGRTHELRLGEGSVRVRIEDESGRIDLNGADDATLESMLISIGLPSDEAQHLAAAVADYRDPDNIKHPGGAEAFDYEVAGLDHGPKNGPFDSPEELMQVLGMTPEILKALSPLITVLSPSREVNRQAASPAVLRALPRSEFSQPERNIATASSGDPEAQPVISAATVVRVTAEATTKGGGYFIREAILRRSTIPTQPFNVLSWRRRWPEP